MPRSTKIVATLGPASSDPLVLERMLAAGVDVVRFNFSHGAPEDHLQRAQLVREASARIGVDVAIMADLQGPKVRVGKFEGGRVTLAPGGRFVLDAAVDLGNGHADTDPHDRADRRRAVEQQGHQQAGRRGVGAGADRQGRPRHRHRDAMRR
jgi:pyruvate kinase